MNLSIIGTGYVGLVSGAVLSNYYNVSCIDIQESKIISLNNGEIPIYEPFLNELISKNVKDQRLSFTTNFNVLCHSPIIFISVGTPSNENGDINGTYIISAIQNILNVCKSNSVIVIKSTITIDLWNTIKYICTNHVNKCNLVFNPEFLAEGSAVENFFYPDRVIIGTNDFSTFEIMKDIYINVIMKKNVPILQMSCESAIMTKLACNTMLANRITLLNEIWRMSENINANISDIELGMGYDPRIGHLFLKHGPGYGGSCFGKDIRSLSYSASNLNMDLPLLSHIEISNIKHKEWIFQNILNYTQKLSHIKTFLILGVAFKSNTDDVRESAALEFIELLLSKNYIVKIHDPQAMKQTKIIFENKIEYMEQISFIDVDAIVLFTEWKEYKELIIPSKIPFFDTRYFLQNRLIS